MRHQHSAHSRAAVSNQLVNEWNDSLFSLPLFCILYLDICRVIDDDDMWYAPHWLLYTVYVAPRVFICCLLFCDERVCVTALWQPVWASLRKWFPVGDIYLIVLSVDCCPYVVNETVTVYPFPLSPYPPHFMLSVLECYLWLHVELKMIEVLVVFLIVISRGCFTSYWRRECSCYFYSASYSLVPLYCGTGLVLERLCCGFIWWFALWFMCCCLCGELDPLCQVLAFWPYVLDYLLWVWISFFGVVFVLFSPFLLHRFFYWHFVHCSDPFCQGL